jgi:prolyl oligopeptidase
MRALFAALIMAAPLSILAAEADDPYLWLEEVQGEKALAWVKGEDAKSKPLLESRPQFKPSHERMI